MASELLCVTHNNVKDLARGQLEMGRNAKATSGCVINVVCVRLRCPCRPHYLGRLALQCQMCYTEPRRSGNAPSVMKFTWHLRLIMACTGFYSAPLCKRCTSYGNSVCLSVHPSVRPSHAGIVSKRRHVARCSLHCRIAKCV